MAACATCGGGKAKRACPALQRAICPTCCGTRRLVEIRCPSDCSWLRASRAHPAAVTQRQRERDGVWIYGLIRDLSDDEYLALVAMAQAALAHRATAVPQPYDEDLAGAAEAVAATAETAIKGLLYEHQPESVVAARLARAISAALSEPAEGAPPPAVTAAAARRLAHHVRDVRRQSPEPADSLYLAFLERALTPELADAATGQPTDILP